MTDSHPIYGLAQGCFAHARALLGPRIPRTQIDRACSFAGVGLDHVIGERVLVYGDDSITAELSHYFLATDRRVFGRHENRPFAIAHTDLSQVQYRPGPQYAELDVVYAQGRQRAAFPSCAEALARFLHTLATQHPSQRTPAPVPLVTPRADDPAGAWLACGRLGDDQRASLMARLVAEKVARSEVPAEGGADLIARVMLQHRLASCGPGAKDGWWLSALSAQDLACAFAWMLGPAVSHQTQGPMHQLVYVPPTGMPQAAPNATTIAGVAAAAMTGVGWTSYSGPIVQRIRLTLRDTPSSSSFMLEGTLGGPPAPLSALAPALQAALLGALPIIEAQLLLCRAIYGWSMPPEQLGVITAADLVANASSIVGAFEPTLFFPPT